MNYDLEQIHKFTKRYEQVIMSRGKEIRLSIEEAGLLNAAILKLLASIVEKQPTGNTPEKIVIDVDSGSFKK